MRGVSWANPTAYQKTGARRYIGLLVECDSRVKNGTKRGGTMNGSRKGSDQKALGRWGVTANGGEHSEPSYYSTTPVSPGVDQLIPCGQVAGRTTCTTFE